MNRNLCALAVLAGLSLLLCRPIPVRAGSSTPDPPPPDSRERITPPDISGVNPDVTLSEGHEGEITPSGIVSGAGFPVLLPAAVEAPPYQELEAAKQEDHISLDWTYHLAVPFREQVGPNDCGAAALGMALEALAGGKEAPDTSALIAHLQDSGLLYENGTGVEELAALARELGYPGSRAFQGWTLEQLAEELAAGHPLVVSLGLNGVGQPGHFVTLSGITGDGQFVRYLDPARGEVVVSAKAFLRQWERQGASGLRLSADRLPPAEDPLTPWLGLFGALSMLMVLARNPAVGEEAREILERIQGWLSRPDRPGLGGSLQPGSGSGGGGTVRVPRYETRLVRKGWKTVEKQVPVYETRRMQVGTREVKKQVPVYEDKKIQVGTRTVTRQVPRFVTKRIQVGARTVKKKVKVTKYKKKVSCTWKKVTQQVPVYRKYGWYRVRVGTRNVTRWKRVRQVRKVPYTSWKTVTKKVPVYKDIRVRKGTKTVTEQVPVYEWRKVQTGSRSVVVCEPVYEDKKVQVSVQTVSGQVPNFERERVQVGWQEVPVLEGGGEEGEIAAAVLKEREDALSGGEGDGESGAPPPWDDELKRYTSKPNISKDEIWNKFLYELKKFDNPHHKFDSSIYQDAADKLHLEENGRRSLDDWFNPYYLKHPQTEIETRKPSRALIQAAEILYGDKLNELAKGSCVTNKCNNPLSVLDLGDDPIDGLMLRNAPRNCNLEMAYMIQRNQTPYFLFLKELGADPYNPWNYDPNWLNELMIINPSALHAAYIKFIDLYEENPEVLKLIEKVDSIGPKEEK